MFGFAVTFDAIGMSASAVCAAYAGPAPGPISSDTLSSATSIRYAGL